MKTLPPPVLAPSDAARRRGRDRPLGNFFSPEAIAVIGASAKDGSVGRALMENLYEFEGRVYPVNPNHANVLRIPAFAHVADVPAKVDLAVIATPAHTVPGIVRECGQAGIKAVIIHSAGFKECGAAGAELERQVLIAARQSGVRVIGPNCLGVMAPHNHLNATFATTLARPGNVAFISQSGALCTAVLDWSLRDNVGFSAFVSVGSMLDVGWGDLITSLGDDPHTHSIIIYMESIGDARSFLSAAREVAFTKPIIVVKAGRTEAAAKAAASHTGALTGSDAVIDAAFRRAGVLRVDTIEDLFDLAEVLGKQPRPAGPRLGIVTNAGGPGALAVDRLVAGGGQVAPLAEKTITELNRVLPPHWSQGNPVDVLGDADDLSYAKAVELVATDPMTDGVLVILTPQAMSDALGTAERIKAIPISGRGKPLLASWMGGAAVEAGEAVFNAAGIPTFEYPDRAAQAFNYMWRYSANLNALYETPTLLDHTKDGNTPHQRADEIIRLARENRRVILTEYESKEILAVYGIPIVTAFPAATESEALAMAAKIGYPVALKLHSETITHKSEVGGVCLNLRDADDVRKAWKKIRRAVADRVGEDHFLGVTVERMITAEGFELILGSSIDAQFGPVILFGAGGRWVEVLQDRAIGLPPLTSTLARRLMEQTRIYSALKGVRGRPPIDLNALEQTLVRFSQIVAEQRWIKEIDVNPLFVSADQIVALDARVILQDPSLAEERLPTLAIRPYPSHYATACTLTDGTPIVLRSIRPEDEPMMVKFHETLSDQSVYYRYFSAMSLTQRTSHARLARLCFIDYDREVALVAVHDDTASGQPEVIGVGRLCKAHGKNEAEFAVVVSDRWQRRGLGTLLLRKLVEIGREEHLARIRGTVLTENHGMCRVCEHAGFKLRSRVGEPEIEATIAL
jgi:acetyltransferase